MLIRVAFAKSYSFAAKPGLKTANPALMRCGQMAERIGPSDRTMQSLAAAGHSSQKAFQRPLRTDIYATWRPIVGR